MVFFHLETASMQTTPTSMPAVERASSTTQPARSAESKSVNKNRFDRRFGALLRRL